MSKLPTVDTKAWRLPSKNRHAAPEASYSSDMYRKMGLPVEEECSPTTGGSGLPVVDTKAWRLPKKEEGRLEERKTAKLELLRVEDVLTETEPEPVEEMLTKVQRRKLVNAIYKKFPPDSKGYFKATGGGGVIKSTRQRGGRQSIMLTGTVARKMGMGDYTHLYFDDMSEDQLIKLAAAMGLMKKEGEEVGEACPSHKKSKKSYLKKTRRQSTGPSRMPDDDAANEEKEREEYRREQRVLAGLEPKKHIEFATGTPHRRLPDAMTEASRTGFGHQSDEDKALNTILMGGSVVGAKKDVEALAKKLNTTVKKLAYKAFEQRMKALKRGAFPVTGTKRDLNAEMQYLAKAAHALGVFDELVKVAKKYSPKKESTISEEQKVLSGITDRSPLPHPMNAERGLHTPRAHGILDDGVDGGEGYIKKVLNESRWFFRDFSGLSLGAFDPLGEAPGGRAGPWRGSKDKSAPTPIVRKGKVHGAVGKHRSPEEKGEVDVGKSEIDYDHDPGDDDEEKKMKVKVKVKSKAPKKEKEPEGDEEGEEAKEWSDLEAALKLLEKDSGVAHGLKSLGHHLRAAGHRVRTSASAQRAKSGLHKHLEKFAKKHGIEFRKHFHGED